MTDEAAKLTEATVLDLLRDRHASIGNGGAGEWAFMPHVRNAAGFNASRTIDALALHLWPSRGLVLHGYEVKVSRSDFLREIKDPAKAEAFCRLVEFFWIVAPAGVVKKGELPTTWGLVEVHGHGTQEDPWRLRTKTAAPCLLDAGQKNRGPIPRDLVVSMLRSVPGAVPGGKLPSASDRQIEEARTKAYGEGYDRGRKDEAQVRTLGQQDLDDWRNLQKSLQEAGLSRHEAGPYGLTTHVQAIASAVKGRQVDRDLRGVRDHLARTLDALDVAMGAS